MKQTRNTMRLIALSLLVAANLAHAQNSAQNTAQNKNDLLSIYRDALANDPTYAAARFAKQAAEERLPQARGALLPTVNATGSYTLIDQESTGPSNFSPNTTVTQARTYTSWGPALQLSMPLFRAQLWNTLDQAKLQVGQAEATLEQARQDLILRVTQAYFDVLAAQDALTAIEASKKAVAEQLAQARREFQVGTKTIVDTHEAQARFDQIAAQEQVARGDLIVKLSALRAIIGRDPGLPSTLLDKPQLVGAQPSDVEAWAKRAQDANYNVAVARAVSEIAKISTTQARNGHLPTLDLTGSVGRTRNSASLSSTQDSTVRDARIGVQLTVPIFAGGITQSRVREALANQERTAQDLEAARRNAAQGARQAYTGVDFGLAQVRALESAEVSAKSQLDSTRLGYQVGVRINLDVLNATTQLFNTQRDLKKARYDFLVNSLRLKSAAGELTEKDVESVNALLAR